MPTPSVEVPGGCKGGGQVVVSGSGEILDRSQATVYLSCPGIESGKPQIVYESKKQTTEFSDTQLQQVADLAEITLKSFCFNCPFNPQNKAPDDLSDLDRRPPGR